MSTSPAIEPPPPAPAFAGLKFTKIGQPPALLQRMQSPEIKTEYRTPSPTPSGPMIRSDPAPQAPSRFRPTLFQALGDTSSQRDQTSTAIAPQPLNAIFSAVQPSASLSATIPQYSASSRVTAGSVSSTGAIQVPSSNILSTSLATTRHLLASTSAAHASTSTNIHRPSSPATASRRDISEDDLFPSGSLGSEPLLPSAPLPINLSAGSKNTDSLSRLLKLVSTRHEAVPKIQKRFDKKTIEFAELMVKAQEAAEAVETQLDRLTTVAEMTREQANRMMQEALKARELAERLYAEAEQIKLDVQKAKEQTKNASERSEDMLTFSRRLFVWLHELLVREGPLIDALRQAMDQHTETQRQAETDAVEERKRREAEAAAAAEARAAEDQRLAAEQQRLAAEAEAKARQVENDRRRAAEAALEEQHTREQQRLAEEARLKEEKEKEYQAKRAAVLADKQRAREVEAVQIRLAREQGLRSQSGSASMDVSPERNESDKNRLSSNATLSVATQKSTPAPVPRITVPTTVAAPTASKSPTALVSPHASLPSRPLPAVMAQAHQNISTNADASSQKTRKVSAMPFVPAQTEAGRQVNTDMPFGSTELARESLARRQDPASPVKTGRKSRSPSARRTDAQANAQTQDQLKKAKKAQDRNAERESATTTIPTPGFIRPAQHSKTFADGAGPPSARAEPSLIPNATSAAQTSQPLQPVIPHSSNATSSYPDTPVIDGRMPGIHRDPRPDNLGGDGGWGDRDAGGERRSPLSPVWSIHQEPSTSHANGQHVDVRRVSDGERYRRTSADFYPPSPSDRRDAPYSRKRRWDGPRHEDDGIDPPWQRARVSVERDRSLDHTRDSRPSRFERSPSPVFVPHGRPDYYPDRHYYRRGLTPHDHPVADSHVEGYPDRPEPFHPSKYDTHRSLSPGTPRMSPDASYAGNSRPNDMSFGLDESPVVDGSPTANQHRSLEVRMRDPPQPGNFNRRGGFGSNNQNNWRGPAQTLNDRGRGQAQGRGKGAANRGRDQSMQKPSLASRIQPSLKDRIEMDGRICG